MKSKSKPRKAVTPRVERTRNGGSETHSQHMGKIRSALRNISRWWKPFAIALKNASHTSYVGKAKRVLYLCACCNKLHGRKNVEVNHIIPLGSLKSYADLPGFCERLFVEDISHLEVLCKECHKEETARQREERKAAE
jgi:5-methylcytosine-specific restriction endonuclease McrA